VVSILEPSSSGKFTEVLNKNQKTFEPRKQLQTDVLTGYLESGKHERLLRLLTIPAKASSDHPPERLVRALERSIF